MTRSRANELLRRGLRAGPVAVARWGIRQARAQAEQVLTPWRARRLSVDRLVRVLGADSLDDLWDDLGKRPFPAHTAPLDGAVYDRLCPGDRARIMAAAEQALSRRVDVLGSGPVDMGTPIDWQRDFKSGHSWPVEPSRRLDFMNLERDSDVKVPWEVSRLQWLIPAGQAYMITREDRFAEFVRDIIGEWEAANPVALGINWACTMDVALRAMTLTWLFHVFHDSGPWREQAFRGLVLRLLYVHGDFISRHLEWSDVNGNHLISDAAGLVFLGHFFERGTAPAQWRRRGWHILKTELPRQVLDDGVDFEAASAYHRLVLELFLLPALYRRLRGLEVGDSYQSTVRKMADFVLATTRPDGSTPLWGDADDGRALPFGGQGINDHRYGVGLVGLGLEDEDLIGRAAGPVDEAVWTFGPLSAGRLTVDSPARPSQGFPNGGVYVMRGGDDYVFIDCGPVGMAGRGGHGHNDCLSFEAVLGGVSIITDCGSYVYSASVAWRNRFRGTGAHNTPMIDGAEQNRLVRPEYLWSLHDDAAPHVRVWEPGPARDQFVGAHTGYRRLSQPVTPVRSMTLDKGAHRLVVVDRFEGAGAHRVSIPYHLAPGMGAEMAGPGLWRLVGAGGEAFLLAWTDEAAWQCDLTDGWVSPSYGVKQVISVLTFSRSGSLESLTVAIMPEAGAPSEPVRWLAESEFSG